ncbi:MAG: histidinol-phosphate transaminase [Gammaproteobacteria bacterium]|nr:histidinol-phosphate transaminase [Gammaproteobacteria bacterium]
MSFERKNISRMQGYTPGEQPDSPEIVKLNTNENPYPPPTAVIEALRAIEGADLRRYPSPLADDFRTLAGLIHGVDPESILAVNGGDELLRLLLTTFVEPSETLAVMQPSYSLYPVLAEVAGCKLLEIPLNGAWEMPDDMPAILREQAVKMLILVNPHAPTGGLLPADYLRGLAREFEGILVLDEAYADFIDPELAYDSIPLVRELGNVLILRTLSKGYSLAGLRFGYGIGPTGLIHPMAAKTRDSYNTDHISQKLARAALESRDEAAKTWERVRRSREWLRGELAGLRIDTLPSQSNFLLASIPAAIGAADLYRALKERGILVRHFDQPRLDNRLRITVGSETDNEILIEKLRDILQ